MVGLSQNYLKQIEDNVEDLRVKMDEIIGLPNNETIVEAIRYLLKFGSKIAA